MGNRFLVPNTVPSGATLLSTTTLSGTSVTLSSIPQTYKNLYVIVRSVISATDNDDFTMNFNADSTASRHSQIWSNDTKVSGGTATAFSLSAVGLASGVDTAATNSLIYIFFPDYTNTATWKWANIFSITNDATTTTSFRIRNGLGIYNQTSAISSLKFNSGQPNTLGGTILLYGVN